MVIGVSGLLGVICVVIGFALGENKVISERSLSTVLTRDLASANAQIQELEKRLIDAELNASVQRSAGNQVRDDMTGLLGRVETLRAEVTFYKSLMAPSDLTAGLQIAELEITHRADRQYHFELLLTQKAIQRRFIDGDLVLEIHGIDGNGNAVVKLVTELVTDSPYPLKFKFRFFQDLTGTFTLPRDFRANSVIVTAMQNGKEPLTSTFAWPDAAGSDGKPEAEAAGTTSNPISESE